MLDGLKNKMEKEQPPKMPVHVARAMMQTLDEHRPEKGMQEWVAGVKVAACGEYGDWTAPIPEEHVELFDQDGVADLKHMVKLPWSELSRTWMDTAPYNVTAPALRTAAASFDPDTSKWSWEGSSEKQVPGGWTTAYESNLSYKKWNEMRYGAPLSVPIKVKEEQRQTLVDFRGASLTRLKKCGAMWRPVVYMTDKIFGSMTAMTALGLSIKSVNVLFPWNTSSLFLYHQDRADGAGGFKPLLTAIMQLTNDTSSMHVLGAGVEAMYDGFGSIQVFPSLALHRSGDSSSNTVKLVVLYTKTIKKDSISLSDEEDAELEKGASQFAETSAPVAGPSVLSPSVVKPDPDESEDAPPAEPEVEPKPTGKGKGKGKALKRVM